MSGSGKKIVAVSNRLPITVKRGDAGLEIKSGAGGLVTALAPVLRNRGGTWIGWLGHSGTLEIEGLLEKASIDTGYELYPVWLTEDEVNNYYHGFSNEVLWPLYHDLQTRCRFEPRYWDFYLAVNKKFAAAVETKSTEEDFVWVHDYHLTHLARELKERGVSRKTGFFLHIPFPTLDIFLRLPWRRQILEAMLEYDLVGFQTLRDRRHFVQCVQSLVPGARIRGRGQVLKATYRGRELRIGTFPISIDYRGFATDAASEPVSTTAWYLHEALPERQVILGVDRLDYTKGIPERLWAFETALERYPELKEKVTLVQVVVPSREDVEEYKALKAEIDGLVGKINGRFTSSGWVPIHYLYRSLDRTELLAYYRLAEIALVTPLKDGMNLVCKEYCACNIEGKGVLVLSEFAGAAAQLHRWALMVNPYDVINVSDAIHKAFTMGRKERRSRMSRMRANIRRQDIFWWVNSFLQAAFSSKLDAFPQVIEDYIPARQKRPL